MNIITRDNIRTQRVSVMLSKAVSQVVLWYMLPSLARIEAITIVLIMTRRNILGWIGICCGVIILVIRVGVLQNCC